MMLIDDKFDQNLGQRTNRGRDKDQASNLLYYYNMPQGLSAQLLSSSNEVSCRSESSNLSSVVLIRFEKLFRKKVRLRLLKI